MPGHYSRDIRGRFRRRMQIGAPVLQGVGHRDALARFRPYVPRPGTPGYRYLVRLLQGAGATVTALSVRKLFNYLTEPSPPVVQHAAPVVRARVRKRYYKV